MNLKCAFTMAAVGMAGAALAAMPSISNVRLSADANPITIQYDLSGADAVVTADVLTNGVSIGVVNFTNMTGAVNCRVSAGQDKSIRWKAYKTWPGHKLAPNTLSVRLTAWNISDPPDYHVTDLNTGDIRYYVSKEAFPGGFWDRQYRTTKLVMKKIPAAMKPFVMGANANELGDTYRQKQHKAMLTNDFYIGVFEVTQAQWMKIYGTKSVRRTSTAYNDAFTFDETPDSDIKPVNQVCCCNLRGYGNGAEFPKVMEVLDWSFLGTLRSKVGQPLTGRYGFDLPTEMEWEFACRGESTLALPNNLKLTNESACPNLNLIAWYAGNGGSSSTGPKPVGSYLPNGYGLYDMVGNVFELCLGWYEEDCSGYPEVDYPGPARGTALPKAVARGGAYSFEAKFCKCASRVSPAFLDAPTATYGFRVLLRLP